MSHAARVERVVAAAPPRVWQALTSAELAAWFWPPRFEMQAIVEAWPGGRFRLASAPMDMGVTGVVAAADPPSRLALTWRWEGEELITDVTIELVGTVDGTTLRVVHDGFPDATAAQDHARGWSDCLERLTGHILTSGG